MNKYLKEWIKKAESDYKVIQHEMELGDDEIVKDAVCFHCQQAIEKYLKSIMIFKNIEVPRTHSIEFLIEKIGKLYSELKNIDIKDITVFGTQVRYPGEYYIPRLKEVNFYVDLVITIRKITFKILKIKSKNL